MCCDSQNLCSIHKLSIYDADLLKVEHSKRKTIDKMIKEMSITSGKCLC